MGEGAWLHPGLFLCYYIFPLMWCGIKTHVISFPRVPATRWRTTQSPSATPWQSPCRQRWAPWRRLPVEALPFFPIRATQIRRGACTVFICSVRASCRTWEVEETQEQGPLRGPRCALSHCSLWGTNGDWRAVGWTYRLSRSLCSERLTRPAVSPHTCTQNLVKQRSTGAHAYAAYLCNTFMWFTAKQTVQNWFSNCLNCMHRSISLSLWTALLLYSTCAPFVSICRISLRRGSGWDI